MSLCAGLHAYAQDSECPGNSPGVERAIFPSILYPQPSGLYVYGSMTDWRSKPEWEMWQTSDTTFLLRGPCRVRGYFAIGDDNSRFVYNGNGAPIYPDTDYALTTGNQTSILCAQSGYYFDLDSIVLTNGPDGPRLRLYSLDRNSTNMKKVYIVGDNTMGHHDDPAGLLVQKPRTPLLKGRVPLKANAYDGLCHWHLRQTLCLGIPWGMDPEHPGYLKKHSTHDVVTPPGTYDITFNPLTGKYTMAKVEPEISHLRLLPEEVVMTSVPQGPIRVLSLGNSLIYCGNQDEVFNRLAQAAGIDAQWTKHTLLGQSLADHWNETGEECARNLVASQQWTHIILQDFSSLAREDYDRFFANAKLWVDYIHTTFPTHTPTILLHANWPYRPHPSDPADHERYRRECKQMIAAYRRAAAELGVILLPNVEAWAEAFDTHGVEWTRELYMDDRHPSQLGTDFNASIAFRVITGLEPDIEVLTIKDHADKFTSLAQSTLSRQAPPVEIAERRINYTAILVDTYGLEYPVDPDSLKISVSLPGAMNVDGASVTVDSDLVAPLQLTVTACAEGVTGTATITIPGEIPNLYDPIELEEDGMNESPSDCVPTVPAIKIYDRFGHQIAMPESSLQPGLYFRSTNAATSKVLIK